MNPIQLNTLSNLSAIIVTIGLIACLLVDLRHGIYRVVKGRSAVLIAVLIWFLMEALQIPDQLARYTQSEYDFGVLCLAVSVVAFLFSYHQIRYPLFSAFMRRLPMLDEPRVLWMLILGGMTIGIGSLLVYSGFDFSELLQGLAGPRKRWSGVGRGRYGSWTTILFELQMFLQATVLLAVALLFMKRVSKWKRMLAGTFVSWMFLRTWSSGSRTPMIPILLALGAAAFWRASPRQRKVLAIAGVPLALITGIYWSAIVVGGRNEGTFEFSQANKVNYIGFEMFRELLFITRATNEGMPLQLGMTYYTQLVNPIPRAIWPGKPVADAGLILARAYGELDANGNETMTISPGFIGEAYLNFGFLGILIVPALAGVVIRAWDELFPISEKSLAIFIIYAGGVATIFMSGRSFNFATFYGLLSLFALMLLFDFFGLAMQTQHAGLTIPRARVRRPLVTASQAGVGTVEQ